MEIAAKTKAFNSCSTFPERDILRAELDALTRLKDMIHATTRVRIR